MLLRACAKRVLVGVDANRALRFVQGVVVAWTWRAGQLLGVGVDGQVESVAGVQCEPAHPVLTCTTSSPLQRHATVRNDGSHCRHYGSHCGRRCNSRCDAGAPGQCTETRGVLRGQVGFARRRGRARSPAAALLNRLRVECACRFAVEGGACFAGECLFAQYVHLTRGARSSHLKEGTCRGCRPAR